MVIRTGPARVRWQCVRRLMPSFPVFPQMSMPRPMPSLEKPLHSGATPKSLFYAYSPVMDHSEYVSDLSFFATILSVLHSFAESVPAARDELFDGDSLRGHVILMYNRERIDADDAKEIVVSDGDEIVLYPPVSGG